MGTPSSSAPCLLIGGGYRRNDLGPLQGIDHVSILRAGHPQRSYAAQRPATCCATWTRAVSTAPRRRQLRPAPCTSRYQPTSCARACRRAYVLPDIWHRGLAPRSRRRRAGRGRPARTDCKREAPGRAHRAAGLSTAGAELLAFLDASGVRLPRYPGEPRPRSPGASVDDRRRCVAARCRRPDLAIVVGRKLDYQPATARTAVWPNRPLPAHWRQRRGLRENRRG